MKDSEKKSMLNRYWEVQITICSPWQMFFIIVSIFFQFQ